MLHQPRNPSPFELFQHKNLHTPQRQHQQKKTVEDFPPLTDLGAHKSRTNNWANEFQTCLPGVIWRERATLCTKAPRLPPRRFPRGCWNRCQSGEAFKWWNQDGQGCWKMYVGLRQTDDPPACAGGANSSSNGLNCVLIKGNVQPIMQLQSRSDRRFSSTESDLWALLRIRVGGGW